MRQSALYVNATVPMQSVREGHAALPEEGQHDGLPRGKLWHTVVRAVSSAPPETARANATSSSAAVLSHRPDPSAPRAAGEVTFPQAAAC